MPLGNGIRPNDMQHHDEDPVRSPLLNLLTLVTLITVLVAAGYLADYYLRDSRENVTWYPPRMHCDLRDGACRTDIGLNGTLRFEINGDFASYEPLMLDVQTSGIDVESAVVEFVGRDMNMGLTRVELEAVGDGHFRGVGELRPCTETVMPWRAQVILETPEGQEGSWFDFDIHR